MAKKITTKEKNELLKADGKQILNYGVKLHIIPNEKQIIQIHKTFGCSRLIYNKYLSDRQDYFKVNKQTLSIANYKKNTLNPSKKTENFSFLAEVDKFALESAVENVEDAYLRFFKHQNKYPKFKSKKDSKRSYTTKFTNDNIRVNLNTKTIQLPKLGEVPFSVPKGKNKGKFANLYNGVKITKVTISQVGANYFISLCIEEVIPLIQKVDRASIDMSKICGVDLGLTHLAIVSNGIETTKYENHKFLKKSEKRLKKLQRRLSKMIESSKNYEKMKLKINELHSYIANCRKDYTHKLSRQIVNENQVIVMETLNIKGMIKNKHLSKLISDAGWYKLITFIKYKAEWAGKLFLQVDNFFASSKLCNVCGEKNIMLTLNTREWICSSCNTIHDRDENASLNLRWEGIKFLGIA